MKICVYGAASSKIDEKYVNDVYNLAKHLGERGHSLVFGAGVQGLMGAAARGFKDAGAKVFGVIPKFFEENGFEGIFYDADELHFTETMAERKQMMEDECDAFVIVPGGIGTFEEFFQVLTLKQLGRHKKAIVVYNSFGYYDELERIMEETIKKGFVNEECRKIYKIVDTAKEVSDYLENYDSADVNWNRLKR